MTVPGRKRTRADRDLVGSLAAEVVSEAVIRAVSASEKRVRTAGGERSAVIDNTGNKEKPGLFSPGFWCGIMDLNHHGVTHTALNRTRLPIPPIPRVNIESIAPEKRFVKRKF